MTETVEAVAEEQFQVGDAAELSVNNVSGRITVRVGPQGSIDMVATKRGRESHMANTRIETSQDGDLVTIQTRQDRSGVFGTVHGMSAVEYDLSVPPGCKVKVKSVSAELSVAGTGSTLQLESVSGDARIEDISGSCEITTVSGDVRARRITGALTVRTTSGDVEAVESDLSTFNFHSVSGDLVVESALSAGAHYYGNTVSGDLTLTVPVNTGASIQMRTVSGRVHSDLPAQIVKSGPKHWQGVINGGGANVELHSVSGNLRIIRGAGNAVEDEVSSVRPSETRDAEVSRVLEALEEGEIGVEEAMAQIKAQRGGR